MVSHGGVLPPLLRTAKPRGAVFLPQSTEIIVIAENKSIPQCMTISGGNLLSTGWLLFGRLNQFLPLAIQTQAYDKTNGQHEKNAYGLELR
jgi:hypothetical protein